jgi:dTDP-4-dehydrorhamnose 3,5-epimerase
MSGATIRELKIKNCFQFKQSIYGDDRGQFFEWFKDSDFELATGMKLSVAQANCSVSQKGVIRGIHFAKEPPGQAKYVTCVAGKVFDVLVDLRKGSPTFGKWESVVLDSGEPSSLYIPSGIGHGFMALEDNTTFVYLCDQRYNPKNEFDISPFDKTLGIDWPKGLTALVSEKDIAGKPFEDLMEHYPSFSE